VELDRAFVGSGRAGGWESWYAERLGSMLSQS